MNFYRDACSSCKISSICKAADAFRENKALNSCVTGCCFYQASGGNDISPGNFESQETKRDVTLDINEVSKKIHNLTKPEDSIGGSIIAPSDDLSCSACGKNNIQLLRCDSCHKLVCADCCTETIDGKTYCPTCYDEADPSIL